MSGIKPLLRTASLSLGLMAAAVLLLPTGAGAQSKNSRQRPGAPADTVKRGEPTAWTLAGPLGFHVESAMDTLQYNYQRQTVPSLVSNAYACTSNLGGEGIDLLYFQRPAMGDFFFADAIAPWIPSPSKQKFYNVYVPATQLSYNFGGGGETHQDRVRGDFMGNVDRTIGIGAFVDYIHSKGCYSHLAVKNFSFGGTFYYTGQRYEMQALYQQFNSLNQENGGITDPGYIYDPAALQGGVGKIETTSIPVNLSDAFNRITGARFYTSQAYKLGYWKEDEESETDTVPRREFVAHTKLIYSLEYSHDRHAFRNFAPGDATDFWKNTYLNPGRTSDVTTLNRVSNTLGISMVEGFRPWAKFALGAYASVESRRYTLPTGQDQEYVWSPGSSPLLTPLPAGVQVNPKHSETILWVGGRLEKTRGSILRYDADARFGLSGDYAGDLHLKCGITTRIPMMKDTLGVRAEASFRNSTPSWLMKHYVSNHFAWSNSFDRTQALRVGGRLSFPKTKTEISAGFENTRGMIYFNDASMPTQNSSPVSVFSASISQGLKLGILNWNNAVTYQETSNRYCLPLPKLTVYSNMYIEFKAFKVLNFQLGADCDYYTKYCGLAYQPALMAFHTQHRHNLGDYAFCNAYLNARLYQATFYVMVSHLNQGWFGNNYFSLPGYPANPRRVMLGLSIDFTN